MENTNYEKTRNIILNKDDLLQIQNLKEYCSKNKDLIENFE